MQTNKRKLVTVRTISAINPIDGADAIEVATVEGWQVVIKKNEFSVGDPCVYFEIDSFLPDGNPAWQFLVDKQPRMFEEVRGHRLRTVKLRGQISQGFVMPLTSVQPIVDWILENGDHELRQQDFSELLSIKKWEQPLPACLAGQVEGLFPSFIRKTDQERCQNLVSEIFGYDDQLVELDVSGIPPEAIEIMSDKGQLVWRGDGYYKILPARADRNAQYEVTLKLDGSSGTYFVRPNDEGALEVGVCSRNLQLKINDENKGNTFIRVLFDTCLNVALEKYYEHFNREIAVQGELMGPSIQGNREEFPTHRFFVFDIYDINAGRQMDAKDRAETLKFLQRWTIPELFDHVPILHEAVTLDELGITNVQELLAFAEGPSIKHKIREGLVFKRLDGQFSFKAISNAFLARGFDNA